MELTEKDIKMPQSPFRYPGSKNKLLPILMDHIDKTLIDQNSFTDVFVGGGSVLLEVANKYPDIRLYANDKDYWVYCFWKVVSDIDSLPYFDLLKLIDEQPTLEQFYKLREEKTTDEVRCAYKAIYFNRTTFSGIFYSGPIGGKDQKSAYTIDCRYNSKKLRTKIARCRELLWGRTTVTNKHFVDLPQMYDDEPKYLDPPYYQKGDALYIEKMSPGDHFDLSVLLYQRKNWVLSYDDCPDVRDLYEGHEIIDLAARYCINGRKDSWEHKNELVILP
jgi:DNA adenine methylase